MKDYTDQKAFLAIDVINTYDVTLTQPEWLQTPGDLELFLSQHEILFEAPLSSKELHAVHALRTRLRDIFSSPDEATFVQRLNTLLATCLVIPSVDISSEGLRVLRLAPPTGTSLVQQLITETSLGLSLAFQRYGKERLRVCAATPCQDVFIDTSRNAQRRYCSERCANRSNIASFRARHRASARSRYEQKE